MKKPKIFTIFKIIGVAGLAIIILAVVLFITGFGNFESNNFMIGMFLFPVGVGACVFGFTSGFKPEIAKFRVQTAKYVQQETKDDLTDLATSTAEIHSEAVTTTAKAVKKGLTQTKYCKHCGAEIDADSKFCSQCGKEQ
ncbi:MAG: zinc ribbon domain-containing protein [Clostridia bacterium]|nr:zinc ribbon domain-containing protein [Clostridia bacterium]